MYYIALTIFTDCKKTIVINIILKLKCPLLAKWLGENTHATLTEQPIREEHEINH